jgi:hypothetical protein
VPSVTVPLAVEKVLFRLALLGNGVVPIARLFLELPLSLEEVEEYADKVADGQTVLKNEWGEFLTYEFPELMRQEVNAALDDCPACGEDLPPPPTEGGHEVRRPAICDVCFQGLKAVNAHTPDESVVAKLKSLFRGEEEVHHLEVMKTEHEIFYLGLRMGLDQFTHTTLASQSRLPSSQLKERLDRMAARRYIQVGLLPSGDAVGYRFPPRLDYPKCYYIRIREKKAKTGPVDLNLDIPAEDPPEPLNIKSRILESFQRPKPKPKPKLNIKIKGRRERPR